MNFQFTIGFLVLFSLCFQCESLRCRTDDGPSEDELKKIARICMKRVGENDTNSESDENSDSDSDQNSGDDYSANQNSNNRSSGNERNNYNSFDPMMDYTRSNGRLPSNGMRDGMNSGMSDRNSIGNGRDTNMNGYQNWNSQASNNWYNNQQNNSNRGRNEMSNGRNGNNNNNYNRHSSVDGRGERNRTNASNNQTEHDRACLVHCFFHELRVTNNEDQPNKNRMINVLTRNIRDVELKQFLIDSIQECFYMIAHMDNYRQQKDKCFSSQTIAQCMTERAKANCEDFDDAVLVL